MYGEKLFQHMINIRNLLCIKDVRLESSKYLNLEISTDQLQILNLDDQDLRRSTILQNAMQKSSKKISTRKINVIGNMVGHCSVLISEENLKRATEDM